MRKRSTVSARAAIISITILLILFNLITTNVFAQRDERAALWDSYQLPAGDFLRFVDLEQGFSCWRPADWSERRGENKQVIFQSEQRSAIIISTEEKPEGYGVANYVTALLQQLRKSIADLKQETVSVRKITVAGYEGRELSFQLQTNQGVTVRETMHLTQVGKKVYLVLLVMREGEQAQCEPILKRLMLSLHIADDGKWSAEFEQARASFPPTAPEDKLADRDILAGRLGEAIRANSLSSEQIDTQLAALISKAPDAALELLVDSSPHVRAIAIKAFSLNRNDTRITELLLWALTDKDVYCSSLAAQALAARGGSVNDHLRQRLSSLISTPAVLVRLAAALDESSARQLAAVLLKSDDDKYRLAGLQLAVALPLPGLELPLAALLASKDSGVFNSTLSAISRRQLTAATPLLLSLFNERMLAASDEKDRDTVGDIAGLLGSLASTDALAQLRESLQKLGEQLQPKDLTESRRAELQKAQEQLMVAIELVELRERFRVATTEAARRAILTEAVQRNKPALIDWVSAQQPAEKIGANGQYQWPSELPSTGETVFPQQSTLYLVANNLQQTLAQLDGALAGIQMEKIRDQMLFVLLLKNLKTQLLTKLQQDGGDFGIDLTAPISLAAWPSKHNDAQAVANSAMVARVTDRERFERLVARYQDQFGNFDSFAITASATARLAGITPAVVPFGMVAFVSESAADSIKKPEKPWHESIYFRHEQWHGLPVTVVERLVFYQHKTFEHSSIYLCYLGNTVLITPSREATSTLLETLQQGNALKQSEAFQQARREQGEVIFFSRLGVLLKSALSQIDGATPEISTSPKSTTKSPTTEGSASFGEMIAGLIGNETGALQLTSRSWETLFQLHLGENALAKSLNPFKAGDLAIPKELLPADTQLYFGSSFDTEKLRLLLRSLSPNSKARFDRDLDQLILPHLQGEMAIALLSIKPLFEVKEVKSGNNSEKIPALIFACRLKDRTLATMLREGKLFNDLKLVADVRIMGAPVLELPADKIRYFLTVTDDYLVIAESVATLQRLTGSSNSSHFADTRDFQRSARAVPEKLALFVTYSLTAALNEASEIIAKDESAQMINSVMGAMLHAFHSQYAYISFDEQALTGKIAVSFDREGRYSIGELARAAGEIDVANALITPKGLNIVDSTRVKSITLRVSARQSGVIERIRDDISRYSWQQVEPAGPGGDSEAQLVFTNRAREIGKDQTITLPVTAPEFQQYLKSTARINAKAPEIVALANTIVGTDRDGRSVARKLGEWTYKNLTWKKVESDVVDTLASREADCLEHSELYVALARSVGLPARVVTGAAFGSGSFGAHAWVEIYLGSWVEVDPTWGVMDYVDATHLRFDGDTFVSYAMLNQMELEILETRRFSVESQREPMTLINALISKEPPRLDTICDLSLTADQVLGAGQLTRLKADQRAGVINSFDRMANYIEKNVFTEDAQPWRVLDQQINTDQGSVLLLDDLGHLTRIKLAQRGGVWYIGEIEQMDNALPLFGDAIKAAAGIITSRWQLEQLPISESQQTLDKIDQLIAREGETAELLLLKARVLDNRYKLELFKHIDSYMAIKEAQIKLLQEITIRWPDFAPGHYELADNLGLITENREEVIASYRRYIQLMSLDPRPWLQIGEIYKGLNRLKEAAAAYRESILRDRENYQPYTQLVAIELMAGDSTTVKEHLATALRLTTAKVVLNDINELLFDDFVNTPEVFARLEALLQQFPEQLSQSAAGLQTLSRSQSMQGRYGDALKTVARWQALDPTAESYLWASYLNRKLASFDDALTAAKEAIKLDNENARGYFEAGCALARLNRKPESLEMLEQAIALDEDLRAELDEEDLKLLAKSPQFKKLKAGAGKQ